jgi:hypothetical protein
VKRKALVDIRRRNCLACGVEFLSWWEYCRPCYERRRAWREQVKVWASENPMGPEPQDGQGGARGSG